MLRGRRKVFVCYNIGKVMSDEVEAENAWRGRKPYRNSTRDKHKTECWTFETQASRHVLRTV